ncbi:MAG: phosphopantetheine-binding protein [Terriglobales bacterium]
MTSQSATTLQNIFRAVFHLGESVDATRVRQLSEERWDSLAHVTLVAAIESEFGVKLELAEALQLTSYEAAKLLLEGKGM